MATHKIALIANDGPNVAALERGLSELDYELSVHSPRNNKETVSAVRGADVIIMYAVPMPGEVIAGIDSAQAIVTVSHGFDGVDVEAATERAIMVANTFDMCAEEVANHTLTLILACSSRLLQLDALVKAGAWADAQPEKRKVGSIYGQTLGMVGFGNIAKATACRAAGFKLELISYDPFVPQWTARDYGVELVGSLSELANRSDFLSMHVPLNNSTWRLAGEALFREMKPTAYFINTCRGGTVDEEALIEALRSGEIAGAGLDVFEQEPIAPDNPLLSMSNVVSTPHSAGHSPFSVERGFLRGSEEIVRILRGSWPMSLVNPEVRAMLAPRSAATNS